MSGGLFSDIPYAPSDKTEKELDAMSTADVMRLTAPTNKKWINLVEYLERRFLLHYIVPDPPDVDATH
jgi:hypothetical protein